MATKKRKFRKLIKIFNFSPFSKYIDYSSVLSKWEIRTVGYGGWRGGGVQQRCQVLISGARF